MADKAKKPADNTTEAEQIAKLQAQIDDLTADLQRTRADFENYRKRMDSEKSAARHAGRADAIRKLLPVVDTIERGVSHVPEHLSDDAWAQGIAKIPKALTSALGTLGVQRIDATQGVEFDPTLHEAIQFDETAEGEREVVAEELQAGYMLDSTPIRPAMVKATRQ